MRQRNLQQEYDDHLLRVNTVRCCYLDVLGCEILSSGQRVQKIRDPDSRHVRWLQLSWQAVCV